MSTNKKIDSGSEKSFVTCEEYKIQIPDGEFNENPENQRVERNTLQTIGNKLRNLFTSWKFWCCLFVLLVCVPVILSIIMATKDEKIVYIESICNCEATTQSKTTTTEQEPTHTTKSTTKKPWNPVML